MNESISHDHYHALNVQSCPSESVAKASRKLRGTVPVIDTISIIVIAFVVMPVVYVTVSTRLRG